MVPNKDPKRSSAVNSSLNRIITFALLASALGGSTTYAAQQARFHLPFAAHWGNVVLEPGDYTLSAPSLSTGIAQFYVHGGGTSAIQLPLSTETKETSQSSYLKFVSVNGTYFLREYTSGPTGKTFTFKVPHPERTQTMAQRTSTAVPVAE